MVNAAFKRDFAVVCKRQVFVHGFKHRLQILRKQRRGRAASEVNRVNQPRILCGPVAPELNLTNQAPSVFSACVFLEGILIKEAVKAAGFTERDVKVG